MITTTKDPERVKSLIKVISGIKLGTTKSYTILSDYETLLISDVLSTNIMSLTRMLEHPTVANDETLKQVYIKQREDYLKLAEELQYQLLQNARPKPSVSES